MNRDLEKYVDTAKRDFQQKELERLGLTPEVEQHEQIVNFFCLLYDEVDKSEVLPPKEKGSFFIKYFCDSIQPLLLFGFKVDATVLSINANIGFPALPTAIFRPDLKMTLVEEDTAKFNFLVECVETLELTSVSVYNSLEEAGKNFDYVIERNPKTLQDFTRVGKEYTSPEGRLYTFRTENFEEELSDITMNKESEGVCVSEIAEYDLANQIYGLNLVAFELY